MKILEDRMSLQALTALFCASAMILALTMAPLSLALGDRAKAAGLSASAATGAVWRGRLSDAAIGGVRLGEVRVGVSPLSLLAARVRLGFQGETVRGAVRWGPRQIRLIKVDADLPLAALLSGRDLGGRISLRDFDLDLRGGRCEGAEGAVALDQLSLRGLELPGLRLSGAPSCVGADLAVPLSGQADGVDVAADLRVSPGGVYRLDLTLRTTRPEVAMALGAAGAQATADGHQIQLTGRLGVS